LWSNSGVLDGQLYAQGSSTALQSAIFQLPVGGRTHYSSAISVPVSADEEKKMDPFTLVQDDLHNISEKMLDSIKNEVPMLSSAAEYFFRMGVRGKRMRAAVVLLLAETLHVAPSASHPADTEWIATQHDRQKGVAAIAEMIHVASLLHDDVLDSSLTRRGVGSVNAVMGNKMAILGGDFLLARASVQLAELENTKAVWLVATMLDNLVKGEVLQATMADDSLLDFDKYLLKSFLKTGSLFAHSAKAVATVGGHSVETCQLAYDYGKSLGLAFQVIDDMLDFTASSGMLGKPAHNDLKSGLATAPVLFAAEEFPGLKPLIRRRFKEPGDVETASTWVFQSKGIERSFELASQHAEKAAQAVREMPMPNTTHGRRCQQALIEITQMVLTRKK